MIYTRTMKEEIPLGWINQKTAAASCGITVVGFQKWKVPQVGKVGRSAYYTVADILKTRLENQRRLVSKEDEDGEETNYGKEKARLTKAQADTAELKNDQVRGELAPIQLIQTTVSRVANQIAAILETIPMKVKRKSPNLTAMDVEIMKKEITKIQNLATEVEVDFDE